MDRRHFLQLSLAASATAALVACEPESVRIRQDVPSAPTPQQVASKGVGLGVGTKYQPSQLDALNVSWFYNWGPSYPAVRPSSGFVPMIWGNGALRRRALEVIRSQLRTTQASELLGFNEPDHPRQANMSVATAIKYWPQLEASGLRLGSPAPVHIGGDWLKEFMDQAAAKDLRVDFVAMHFYGSANPDSFLNKVEDAFDRYGKPIWITEYAVADWDATVKSPSQYSQKEVTTFMSETAEQLRQMPFVERFAWKTRAEQDPVMGYSALFRRDGSLTATGELYQSL